MTTFVSSIIFVLNVELSIPEIIESMIILNLLYQKIQFRCVGYALIKRSRYDIQNNHVFGADINTFVFKQFLDLKFK